MKHKNQMKKLTLTLAAIAAILTANAQNSTYKSTKLDGPCGDLVEFTTDEMTGKGFYANTLPFAVKGTGIDQITFTVMHSPGRSFIFSMDADGDIRCVDKEAQVIVLFTDGSKITMATDNKFNCKGNAVVYMGKIFGRNSELRQLREKKIKAVRVYGYQSTSVQADFTAQQANDLNKIINCISDKMSN